MTSLNEVSFPIGLPRITKVKKSPCYPKWLIHSLLDSISVDYNLQINPHEKANSASRLFLRAIYPRGGNLSFP